MGRNARGWGILAGHLEATTGRMEQRNIYDMESTRNADKNELMVMLLLSHSPLCHCG